MATGFQEASLTVCDLIQKSKLISEGPPARYRLLTTRSNLETDGSVRKWTFGQQNIKMQNKILLMVGEAGTGKTTLINGMVNYILGVEFEDEVWFEITEERRDNHMPNHTKSQTTHITVYEVFAQDNPMCLTIIDTPGYGDNSGIDADKQIAKNLYKLFHNDTGVKEIDAVCLVLRASENHLSNRHYIFDAVLSLFGKDIENNIVFCITHSDGMPPTNVLNAIRKAGIPYRKDEENEPEHFLFNNRQTEARSVKYNRPLQAAWELTEESLNDFFLSLKQQNRKGLKQTENVLDESQKLETCMRNMKDKIAFVDCKRKELIQIQKALEENREKMKKNKNFTFTLIKYHKEKVSIKNASWWNRKATSCSVCEENCHEYNCWFAWKPQKCKVMTDDHCTVCTSKCHYSKHRREKKKYVTRSKETIMTFDDLKKQYEGSSSHFSSNVKFDEKAFENVKAEFESNKKQEEEKTNIQKKLQEDLTKIEKTKAELVEKAYKVITNLCKIALKPDSALIVESLDFLIPQAEETGKHDYAQKLKELRKIQPESQERVTAAVRYARASK